MTRVSSGSFVAGIVIGSGAVLLASGKGDTVRPFVKAIFRASVLGFRAAHRAAAELGEAVEDLVAETMYEIDVVPVASDASATTAAKAPTDAD